MACGAEMLLLKAYLPVPVGCGPQKRFRLKFLAENAQRKLMLGNCGTLRGNVHVGRNNRHLNLMSPGQHVGKSAVLVHEPQL
jgi:hypothetical protein